MILMATAQLFPFAYANSCTTQAQMTPALRQELVSTAHLLIADIQTGNILALRDDTLGSVAANFSGIAQSARTLEPEIRDASITVDTLIEFDATASNSSAGQQAQFFCSPPNSTKTIVLTFPLLPKGSYALAIVHATGIPNPQQISLILTRSEANQWKLAGFFQKPLTLNGQSGIWYWKQAQQYESEKMNWAAWYYYQIAKSLVMPVDFLSSPNLEQLEKEASQVQPQQLSQHRPMIVDANGAPFSLTRITTTTELGPLDLEVHYVPDASESAVLSNPVQARRQAVTLMITLLALHPGIRKAFHGIWVFADSNNATAFALELPMNQIPSVAQMNKSGLGQ